MGLLHRLASMPALSVLNRYCVENKKTSVFLLLYREKASSSLLCVSFTIHVEHFTSDSCEHQMSGGFTSDQAILYDTSGVSYNLAQFYHCLPGVSTKSNRVRAQSHRTAPSHKYYTPGYPQLLPDLTTNKRFPQPPSQVRLIC